ncbi:MAG TPA: CDP-alcohol phosphatidyltransferase family protein [Balneolaceae bacterium]|nr:CDP-alcohol phosphatidyltransferase family protein [Balneolaceae bacterium]
MLSPVFLYLFFQEDFLWKAIGLGVFIVAAVTDYFDGYFARKYKTTSDFGAFLDPLADKFLTFSGFFVMPFIAPSQFPWWAIGLIIFRDIFITLFRVYTKRKEQPMVTRMTAKIKTTVQMVFLYIGLAVGLFKGVPFFLGDWIDLLLDTEILFYMMLFVTFVTVYTGIEYLVINRAVFKKIES